MNSKRNMHLFPVASSMKDKEGTQFTNEIEGGVTFRDFIAIEFAKGFFANPAYLASRDVTAEQLLGMAVKYADQMVVLLDKAEPESNVKLA